MLVFSRKKNEKFVIRTPQGIVTINVNDIRGDRVSIGIDAPGTIEIHRKEVADAIAAREAAVA